MNTLLKSYDDIPYDSFSFPETHAAHLFTIGKLFGTNPPDFKKARVLEIGCAAGGNLIPQAVANPAASFTGIDFSETQIAQAQSRSRDIANIEFIRQDILEFDTGAHRSHFDYIIAHGVLSWVPPQVQEKVLDICAECLSPNGLAVISYNVLPGWNLCRSAREVMLYHTRNIPDPAQRMQEAQGILQFLSEHALDQPWAAIMRDELGKIRKSNPTYVYHEYLEEVNYQFYFHDFAAKIRSRQLEYLGDGGLSTMNPANLPEKTRPHIAKITDIVTQEQYMDFITNRRFRSSIICRQNVKISRNMRAEQIFDFHLSAPKPLKVSEESGDSATLATEDGAAFVTKTPAAKALFLQLGPTPVSPDDLVTMTAKILGSGDRDGLRQELQNYGMALVLGGIIHLHSV